MSISEMLQNCIHIQVSQDKMTAYIQFKVADEKFVCSASALEEYARSHDVRYGLAPGCITKNC